MATIKRCDMCHKEIKPKFLFGITFRRRYYKVTYDDAVLANYKEYDLCESCRKKVQKFIEEYSRE